jgi:uncharacterized membrane protein
MMMNACAVVSQNELMTLLFGIAGAVFIFRNRQLSAHLPRFSFLVTAYLLLVVAWAAACGEGLPWADAFLLLEHCCYLASSVLMAVWCWSALRPQREAGP